MKKLITRRRRIIAALTAAFLLVTGAAIASEVDVSVVDVTSPTNSVTFAPGGNGTITINMSVTGRQDGTATFEVYRDWTLSGGTFSGSNPQEFTVPPRSASDLATTFTTAGSLTVASGQVDGAFTLTVGAFDITNTNTSGAKLSAGASSTYQVTVETPAASDTTAPEITIITPGDGDVYTLGQVVLADYGCEDETGGSGVASCEGTFADGTAIDTSSVGAKAFTVNAADNAGNEAALTHNYSVVYDWTGFFRPVDALPTLNAVKAGSAIPVKFSLSGDQGLAIFASGHPSSAAIACDSTANVDGIEQTVTAGASSLSYDATVDQYTYVWKTDKSWTGCRQLVVKLVDGTLHRANFKFTR